MIPGLPQQVPPAGVKWEVTYPNGAVQEFDHEWAAVSAKAMSGGDLKILVPEPVAPRHSTG